MEKLKKTTKKRLENIVSILYLKIHKTVKESMRLHLNKYFLACIISDMFRLVSLTIKMRVYRQMALELVIVKEVSHFKSRSSQYRSN